MTDHAELDKHHASSRAGLNFTHLVQGLAAKQSNTETISWRQKLACFPSMALETAAKARDQLLLKPGSLAPNAAAVLPSARA